MMSYSGRDLPSLSFVKFATFGWFALVFSFCLLNLDFDFAGSFLPENLLVGGLKKNSIPKSGNQQFAI